MRIAGMFLVASLSFTAPGWGQFSKQDLLPSSRNTGASFGSDVALSADGTVALVGAPGEQAAYIFRFGPGGWSQEARLVPDVPAGEFGLAVALSGDGKVALVGAQGADSVAIDAGAVYAFGLNGGTWQQEAVLREPFPAAINRFGVAVALSGDGSVGLVGAPYDYCEGHCGSAFSFTRTSGVWSFESELRPVDHPRGSFGFAVSLSPDGGVALVGAPFEPCDAGGFACGAAYLYGHGAGNWTQQARLTASDAEAQDLFGLSVALSLESGTALIGAPNRKCTAGSFCGAVYVFRGGGTTWTEQQRFASQEPNSYFGRGLALSADGATLLIKAPGEDCSSGGADCGAVYRSILLGEQWAALRPIAAFPPNSFNLDTPGLALSADGSRGLVGASQTPCEQGASCGIAYVFSLATASVEVPALDGLGLALLAILLAGSGAALLRRRRRMA